MRVILSMLLLFLAGCTASTEPAQPASTPVLEPVPDVAAHAILLRFKTLDCVCHLGNVEFALLDLPGVGSVEWDIDHNAATLIFIDEQRPTDDAIRDAIADSGVEIASIVRPDSH